MANMNIFESDAFSLMSLSGAVERMEYVPQFLGQLGVFKPKPVTSSEVWIDVKDNKIGLIQTSSRGTAPEPTRRDERSAIPFKVPRISKEATIQATEIAGLRAFGSESEQDRVQKAYLERMDTVRNAVELTQENMRLGAIKGIVIDADGSIIADYFSDFGIAPAAPVAFNLGDPTTDVNGVCRKLVRSMQTSSKGAITLGAKIHAVVGHDFFDALIAHPNVEKFYANWMAAESLRTNSKAFGGFEFGDIVFHDYRGTNDGTTVAVAANEAHFFPVGANDVFSHMMAPADEFIPYVGASGQNTYMMNIIDHERQAWTRGEIYSYPLMMCSRPEVLRTGLM